MRHIWAILLGAFVTAASSACESQNTVAQVAESELKIPLTASEWDGIRLQILQNWNVSAGGDQCPLDQRKPVELRIHLEPNGTVTKVEPLSDLSQDPCGTMTYDGAKRAVLIASPLKLPAGRTLPTLVVRFDPAAVVE